MLGFHTESDIVCIIVNALTQLPQFTPEDFFPGLETVDCVRPSRLQLAKVDVAQVTQFRGKNGPGDSPRAI